MLGVKDLVRAGLYTFLEDSLGETCHVGRHVHGQQQTIWLEPKVVHWRSRMGIV